MKKLVLTKPGVLSLTTCDSPLANDGELIVTVEVAGLGGSEYLGLKNPGIRTLPNVMAHGITGYTDTGNRVAINPLVTCRECLWCKSGQPQLCNEWQMIGVHRDGGFAQQLALPIECLVNIPDSLSWEQSSFIEPFANSVNAVDLSGATKRSTIAVLGAGGLGLGIAAACVALGCDHITVIDPSASRIQAAEHLGGSAAGNAMKENYDIVFDTVGTAVAREKAISLTTKMGTCVLLGFGDPRIELDGGSFIRSQKRMIGAFAYSSEQFSRAIGLAQKTKSEWVRSLSFEEVQVQLETFLSGNFDTIKAVLRPNC